MKITRTLPMALAATALLTQTIFAQSWETVVDYQYVPNLASEAHAIAVDGQGNIYAAGYGRTQTTSHGLVMRSGDQGTTWTLVQDYAYPNPTNNNIHFTSIGFDQAQNIYVV